MLSAELSLGLGACDPEKPGLWEFAARGLTCCGQCAFGSLVVGFPGAFLGYFWSSLDEGGLAVLLIVRNRH